MQADFDQQHPYIQLLHSIEQQGVVVIDNIPRPPAIGEAYIAQNLLIIVCHQGAILNSETPEYQLRTHDVSVLMPDQIVLPTGVTPDLRCTNIAVSRDFYDKLVQMCPYTRRASIFRRRPPCLLTEEQFSSVMDAVNLIRTLSRMDSVHRLSQLAHLLDILLCMLHDFHVANYPDEKSEKESLFTTFYEHLIKHCHESHEIAFYARKCYLSPKHFSEVIKEETGISALKWITDYVIIQAKMLLDSHQHLTIQQISHRLGFTEQSSFSRYFKANTGMTPSEYRKKEGVINGSSM